MRILGHVTLVAIAVALVVPSAANAQGKLEGRSVKIGCLAPLTGKGAEWGQAAKPSMEIAAEEINAKGGIGGVPIELICYDTQTLEAEALKAMSRLVDRDKVLVISGPCFSGEFETIAPQLDSRFKTVINSYCSAKPGLSAMSKWAFRNTLTSDKQLKPVVAAWVAEYKPKKVVIIYDAEDAVSKGEGAGVLPALFKEHNIEVLEQLTYRTKTPTIRRRSPRRRRSAPRASGSAPAIRTPPRSPRRWRSRGSTCRSSAARARAPPASSRSPARRRKGLHVDRRVDRRSASRGAGLCEEDRCQAERADAALQRAARLRHHLFVQALHREGGRHQQALRPRQRSRQDPRLPRRPEGFPGVAGEITMDEVRDGAGSSAILKVVNGKYVNMAKPATN
jgi:hypothetical protein